MTTSRRTFVRTAAAGAMLGAAGIDPLAAAAVPSSARALRSGTPGASDDPTRRIRLLKTVRAQ